MVLTPWGESEGLRERRLPPGPATPRDEVLANQRERLFGAMVANVAARGYRATTVSDLARISGVSSRTFYDLFPDKEACFLATLEAMIQAAIAFAAQRAGEPVGDPTPGGVTLPANGGGGAESWEESAGRGMRAFAEMIVAQPAAARLALVEAYTAGPEALVPLEQAMAGFEWLTRQLIERSPERAGMPAEMLMALMGSQQEIARNRLREGREGELPGLTEELWGLLLSYRPPPAPLRLAGRPPRARAEVPEAHDHAERALQALAEVVAEEGYSGATVDAVVKRAQMSATTFYANFAGKDDAMLAAIDGACSQTLAAVMPAFRRAPDWPHGIRAAFGALFNFLASRPALANLAMVEVYAAGLQAMQQRTEALHPLQELIAEGRALRPEMHPITAEGIVGGVYTLAYRRLREGGAEALPALAPICTYITLSPFVGPEEACRIANGDGRGRGRG
ncbi:MAG TPA: TetR/AcrR family transcriptional regulator [Solirubrobacterales bacterium]|nr:TetR/AcrR family transcriptional regulator [Solirubrobacterales bacterium]